MDISVVSHIQVFVDLFSKAFAHFSVGSALELGCFLVASFSAIYLSLDFISHVRQIEACASFLVKNVINDGFLDSSLIDIQLVAIDRSLGEVTRYPGLKRVRSSTISDHFALVKWGFSNCFFVDRSFELVLDHDNMMI